MSDLISRQVVFDALIEKGQNSKRYKLGEKWELDLPEIIEAINAISSAEPEQKWIPVSEALPEDMDRLLATIIRSDGEKRVRSGLYYDGYFMMDNGDIWNETDEEILAWMPLVEPYKEGE